MLAKKETGSKPWIDPDDAPELTPELLAEAEVYQADQFVRRARGRPLSDIRKEKINVRLHPAVLERLRAAGPGWQTHIDAVLRLTTRVDPYLWDQMEDQLDVYTKRIEELNEQIDLMERGVMHTNENHVDTTARSIEWCKRAITSWSDGIDILHDIQMKLFRDAQEKAA